MHAGVEAYRGLIQEKYRRAMHEVLGDFEPPDHAAGKMTTRWSAASESPIRRGARLTRWVFSPGNAIEPCRQQHVLASRERTIRREQLRNIADASAHLSWLPDNVITSNCG